MASDCPSQVCHGSATPLRISRHRYVENRDGEKNVNATDRDGPSRAGHGPVTIVVSIAGASSEASLARRLAIVRAECGEPTRFSSSSGSCWRSNSSRSAVVVLHVLVARGHDTSERSGSRLVREEREPGARRRSLAHPLAVLDQQGRARAARGAVHERDERSSVRVPREPGQLSDGGRDIDVRHQRSGRGCLARVEHRRVAHDHRDTHGLLVRVGLAEPAMFAEQEPVVRQVDHERVARAIAEAVEDVADTVIERADRVRHLREAASASWISLLVKRAPSRVQRALRGERVLIERRDRAAARRSCRVVPWSRPPGDAVTSACTSRRTAGRRAWTG